MLPGPRPRPCFNPQLLSEVIDLKDRLQRLGLSLAQMTERPHFAVFASKTPEVFNLGGDLGLFPQLIDARDRQGARDLCTGMHRCLLPCLDRL